MISFCVLCLPPSHRRASASKTKKLIIELYTSYNEISRSFENTNYTTIGEYSKFISSKYSLNQLTYSVILNGNINVYGRTIKNISGNNYLLLIYYKNSDYITYLNKSTSLQILDDSISTYINIFIHKNKTNTNIKVLQNIQNCIDLLQTVNAQTSHEPSQLVYWDNKCKNYTQQIINNSPNKKPLNTNIFTNNNNNYDHNKKRYSDFFTHSKYKNTRKSFYASSNSQKNLLNKQEYKWSRKSTTQIPQIDTIQTQTQPNEKENINAINAYKLDAKYEHKLKEIRTEMIGLFELCDELKLNKNDDDDENENDNKEQEDLFSMNDRDLISQSKTESIAFTSNATMVIHDSDLKEKDDNGCEIESSLRPRHRRSDKTSLVGGISGGNPNFGHHKTMSGALIQFQSQYKEANKLKIALITNLKGLLKELENDILPSFDDDSDSDSNKSSERDKDKEDEIEELKEKCFDWLKLLTTQMSVNDMNNGLKLQKMLFEGMTHNNEYKELYNQMYLKISKHLPYINSNTNATSSATLTPYNTPNISRINTPNMSRSSSTGNTSIINTPSTNSINNVRVIKEDFASEFNDNRGNRKRIRHSRGKSDISEVINDCSVELKQQFNDMMGTIGDDTQFKQKLTDLLVEIANNYTDIDDSDIYYETHENDPDTNKNNKQPIKKRESLIIHTIKTNFVEKIIQLEKDIEINNKYFNLLPNWDFDPIAFNNDNKVNGNCVVLLTWHLIKKHNYHIQFGISANKLINFLYQIQESYQKNLYHNKYHATDVINNIYWFTNTNFMKTYLKPFHQFILLLAAAIHDVNHDGKNNSYHARTKSYLAIRYNDQSILENYHIAYSFKLISSQNNCDWINDLKDEKIIEKTRKFFIQLVLGTDMSFHKKHLNHMNELINKLKNTENNVLSEDDIFNLCAIVLHACDIGNAAKKRDLCVEWAKRCIDEFRIQGDDELKLFGKESQLLFSRKHPLEKSQVGWIKFVMLPFFNPLNKLLNNDIKHLIDNLNDNVKKWGKYKEFIKNLNDHEKKEDK